MKIAFLASCDTLPGSATRRVDAFEHDLQISCLRSAFAEYGDSIEAVDWRLASSEADRFDAAVIGTAWDYQDDAEAFITALEAINARIPVLNPPKTVRWNIHKTYLRDLASAGAPVIPTLWRESPSPTDIENAYDLFETSRVVVKRQVGAGAEGQSILKKGGPDIASFSMDRAAMIQPFLPAISEEGEFSFVFIGEAFSHALIKRPRSGDYRIQSAFGGTEHAVTPDPTDLDVAKQIHAALPIDRPLYSRIDMVRNESDQLLLMEAELVEPYLYPEQGPRLGHLFRRELSHLI